MPRIILAAVLLGAAQAASAELIDDFSASQGPLTVGPGQEISESEGILETPSVLGGFRVLAPALDEEAPGGSTVTASVAGGEFTCQISIAGGGGESGGGCGSAYDRSNGPLFDLSSSTAFELDIASVSGGGVVQVAAFGPDNNSAMAFIESPTPGNIVIPFAEFMTFTPTPLEWDRVDAIVITVGAVDGDSGHVAIDRIGTDGPIANGEAIPGEEPGDDLLPDAELRDKVYGNFYNPLRSGEGIQLTLEADRETFILTYYTYLDGDQVWLIGTGALDNGRIVFSDMSITGGADYGGGFDSDDVEVTPFGEIEMAFLDCDRAVLTISPSLDRFDPFTVEMQRIAAADCGAGPPPQATMQIAGNWYDPARSGEGFQLAYEDGRWVLTFYTYRNGEQVWMIGTGDRLGDTLSFPEVYVTDGGDFGGRFRAEDVSNILFGGIEMTLDDCNNATVEIDASLSGFTDQTLDVGKIVPADICQN